MNEHKPHRSSPPAVGGASLLVVFAVLCLTTFALLSLSTVQADNRLAQSSANAVASYYRADCQAQEILAQLRAGNQPPGVTAEGDVYSYICPISDTQNLAVTVRITQANYAILSWKAVSADKWEPDNRLHLWDGEIEKGE